MKTATRMIPEKVTVYSAVKDACRNHWRLYVKYMSNALKPEIQLSKVKKKIPSALSVSKSRREIVKSWNAK